MRSFHSYMFTLKSLCMSVLYKAMQFSRSLVNCIFPCGFSKHDCPLFINLFLCCTLSHGLNSNFPYTCISPSQTPFSKFKTAPFEIFRFNLFWSLLNNVKTTRKWGFHLLFSLMIMAKRKCA